MRCNIGLQDGVFLVIKVLIFICKFLFVVVYLLGVGVPRNEIDHFVLLLVVLLEEDERVIEEEDRVLLERLLYDIPRLG